MASKDAVNKARGAVRRGLRAWLAKARDAVLAPWQRFRAQPNPEAIGSTVPAWQAEVDRILAALEPAIREGWVAADLPGDLDINDPYIQANLALTKNLLVRIPDEVHAQVIAAILAGVNAGEPTEQIAQRVQNVLDYTGSEDWPGRADLISRTECARHFNGSMLAHGLARERAGAIGLTKRWDTRMDGKERIWHHDANGQLRPLAQPFQVGGEDLLFPVDPRGRPSNVINCVPAWQSVSVRATGFVVRRFSGMLVNLVTTGGNKVSATPNHPIRTWDRGWIPIGAVEPTDYVLCCTEPGARTGSIHPDIADSEPIAEQVARLLEFSVFSSERMTARFVDLDGQVLDKQVSVVRANRMFPFGCYTKELEQLSHLSVHGGGNKVRFTPNQTPGFQVQEPNVIRLGRRSNGAPIVLQDTNDVGPLHAKLFAHSLDRGTLVVSAQDGVLVSEAQGEGYLARSLTPSPSLHKHGGHDPLRKAQASRDLYAGDALSVKFKNFGKPLDPRRGRWASYHAISSLTRQWYSGEVYDFETVDGLFSAGGVIVANCRCDLRLLGGN